MVKLRRACFARMCFGTAFDMVGWGFGASGRLLAHVQSNGRVLGRLGGLTTFPALFLPMVQCNVGAGCACCKAQVK